MIIVFLVGARGWFEGDDELYAYAIGVVVGTVIQLLMAIPVLRRLGLQARADLRPQGPAASSASWS